MANLKLFLIAVLALGSVSVANADKQKNKAEESFGKTGLVFSGQLRPRFEYVDTDATGKKDADSLTNRTLLKLGYISETFPDFKMFIALTNVTNFGVGHYNNYRHPNDNPEYAKIMEPAQTRLTEGYAEYTFGKEAFLKNTQIVVGRQRLNLENRRFLGDSDWRQMYKTHDAVQVVNKGLDGLTLTGIYSARMHGVDAANFKDISAANPHATNIDNDSIWLNANYKVTDKITVAVYDYMIEDLNDTYGASIKGKTSFQNLKTGCRAEYAKQFAPCLGDDDISFDNKPSYTALALTGAYAFFTANVGYTNQEKGFVVPYGCYHKFNGIGDEKFTKTNLETVTIGGKFKLPGNNGVIKIDYHFFSRSNDDTNLGKEVDFNYNVKFNKQLSLIVATSQYMKGSSGPSDTSKYWVQFDYKF